MANLRKYSSKYVNQGVSAIFGGSSNVRYVCESTDLKANQSVRKFSRTSQLAKKRNFYDDLGIPKSSTQSEIKSAYYNLSMAFHPDKNKGCEDASKRFRQISEAYEVLGNFRTRRMYDKGIGSFGREEPSTQNPGMETEIIHEEVEDDAQTKFYKQHMVKSEIPTVSGESRLGRDLDNWQASKITQSFEHQQYMKRVIKNREEDEKHSTTRNLQYFFVSIICFLVICVNLYYQHRHNKEYEALLKKHREKNL